MPCALDSDSQLTLLLSAQASLADRLDLAVCVDIALQRFNIFVVKICWRVFFESFHVHFSLDELLIRLQVAFDRNLSFFRFQGFVCFLIPVKFLLPVICFLINY